MNVREVTQLLICIALTLGVSTSAAAQSVSMEELLAQLHDDRCGYEFVESPPRCVRATSLMRRYPLYRWTVKKSHLRCPLFAVRCLESLGRDALPAFDDLIEMQRQGPRDDTDPKDPVLIRSAVLRALGAIGDARAIPELIGALSNSQPSEQAAAASALGMFGGQARDAAPALIELVNERGVGALAAVDALGHIHDTRALPTLIGALSTDRLGASAAEALGEFGAEGAPAVLPLMEIVGTDIPPLSVAEERRQVAATKALGALGDERALPVLYVALRSPILFEDACHAIAKFTERADDGVPILASLLDPTHQAEWLANGARQYSKGAANAYLQRLTVVSALSQIGTKNAVKALQAVQSDIEIGGAASEALQRIGASAETVR